MTDLNYSVSHLSRGPSDATWPRPRCTKTVVNINHIGSINYPAWLRMPGV